MVLLETHKREWVEGSGVSPEIVELNVESFGDDDIDEIDDRLNRTALRGRWQKKLDGSENPARWRHGGGWWVSGVDPTTGMSTNLGGQFKPDKLPTLQEGARAPKYFGANGKGMSAPLFLETPDRDFWRKVLEDIHIPITITEGAKKAGKLLTDGEAAVSLPGVWNGEIKGRLKKELEPFCQFGRVIRFAFDMDLYAKPNVAKALKKLAATLASHGCKVFVLQWNPADGKGIDDYLVNGGNLEETIESAVTIEEWDTIYDENKEKKVRYSFYQEALRDLYLKGDDRWICVDEKLYRWTGTYYKECEKPDELRRIFGYCNEYKVETKDEITYPYASPGYIGKVWSWVQSAFSVSSKHVNPPGLNCLNGVLQLRWEKNRPFWSLVPHSPDRYYLYEPQAKYDPLANPAHCERLLECLDAPEREIFLRNVAASFDLPQVRLIKGRSVRALLLKGLGNNGKDTLREVVSLMYGKVGMTSLTLQDFISYDQGRKFTINKARHARIAWSSENSSFSSLDNIQCLKAFITGDPISFEGKNKDEEMDDPRSIVLFNCNESPSFTGALEAIQSRFAVVSFSKTFKVGANPNKGELEADPRFKHDQSFLRDQVLPAFLNRLIQALNDLVTEGIDYEPTLAAFQEMQIESNHLYQFCHDFNLNYDPQGRLYAKEIWDSLKHWYEETGTLEIDANGKQIWTDQAKRNDKNVKAVNQVVQRFLQLFPKAKKGKDVKGIYLHGIAFNPRNLDAEAIPDAEAPMKQTEAPAEAVTPIQQGVEALRGFEREPEKVILTNQATSPSTNGSNGKTAKTNSNPGVSNGTASIASGASEPASSKDSSASAVLQTASVSDLDCFSPANLPNLTVRDCLDEFQAWIDEKFGEDYEWEWEDFFNEHKDQFLRDRGIVN